LPELPTVAESVQGYDPRIIAPARRISDAVHKSGAVMLVQISHRGLAALPVFSRMPVWAPGPSRSPHAGEMAHAVIFPSATDSWNCCLYSA
jgi:2,4-dienoyl-CoA reductase-like NADH-dependent reductase (Old Yellow Enzyme family)